jgi:hypothetical protein
MSDERRHDETDPEAYEAPAVEDLDEPDGPAVTAAGVTPPG